jgi:type IV secretory pathway VirB2 component (pilin)
VDKLIRLTGNAAALLGILICLLAGVARMAGNYHLLGYESMTLFTGGIALMVAACLAKLYQSDFR